jgi:hypothetical protein
LCFCHQKPIFLQLGGRRSTFLHLRKSIGFTPKNWKKKSDAQVGRVNTSYI